jgi:hypothetical protein
VRVREGNRDVKSEYEGAIKRSVENVGEIVEEGSHRR